MLKTFVQSLHTKVFISYIKYFFISIFSVRKGFSSYTPPPRLTPSTTPTTKWRPKCVVQDSRKYQRSHRPAAVSHNQFVNNPKVASKVVIPEHSTLNTARNIPPKNKKNEQNHEIQRSQITDLRSRLNMNGSNTSKTTRNLTTQISRSSDQLIHDEDTLNPCTSLMSTRKRITRKMSEINLEKDSGISSPMELVRNYEAAAPITPKVIYLHIFNVTILLTSFCFRIN